MRHGSVSVMLKQVLHSLIRSFTSMMLLPSSPTYSVFELRRKKARRVALFLPMPGSLDRFSMSRSMGSG